MKLYDSGRFHNKETDEVTYRKEYEGYHEIPDLTEFLEPSVYIDMRRSQIELSKQILLMKTYKGFDIDEAAKKEINDKITQWEAEILDIRKGHK